MSRRSSPVVVVDSYFCRDDWAVVIEERLEPVEYIESKYAQLKSNVFKRSIIIPSSELVLEFRQGKELDASQPHDMTSPGT